MKNKKISFAAACILILITACKKSDSGQQPTAAIVGKWNEVRLHESHTINGTTTDEWSKPGAFTAFDYATFDNASSAIIYRSGIDPMHPTQPAPEIIYGNKYTYIIDGDKLTLISTTNSVKKTETIIKLDQKNLILHESYFNGTEQISKDSYFVKE